jgi:hypothetical protein
MPQEGHPMKPLSFAKIDTSHIRCVEDLLVRIESNPHAAAEISGMDPWERWVLGHGMSVLIEADLDEWQAAALKCIVRHSGPTGRIPQAWLFEGGPDNDLKLRELSCLNDNARKQRIKRLIDKVTKLRVSLQLSWKVERSADCSKTIYTAYTAIHSKRDN